MLENRFKPEQPEIGNENADTKTKVNKRVGLNASFLFNNIYFIFYIAFLGLIYIANSHNAVNTIKTIKETQNDLKALSYECNSKKSDLMFQSMESIIAQKVVHLNLRELKTTPKKILNKNNY